MKKIIGILGILIFVVIATIVLSDGIFLKPFN